MRYLALDCGEIRVGLAGSDSGSIITPLEFIDINNNNFLPLTQKINSHHPEYLIVGLPVSTDGRERESAKKVRQFINNIKDELNVKEIKYTNEIYTTIEAQERAKAAGWKKGEPVDHFAAAVILEQFLNTSKTSN